MRLAVEDTRDGRPLLRRQKSSSGGCCCGSVGSTRTSWVSGGLRSTKPLCLMWDAAQEELVGRLPKVQHDSVLKHATADQPQAYQATIGMLAAARRSPRAAAEYNTIDFAVLLFCTGSRLYSTPNATQDVLKDFTAISKPAWPQHHKKSQ